MILSRATQTAGLLPDLSFAHRSDAATQTDETGSESSEHCRGLLKSNKERLQKVHQSAFAILIFTAIALLLTTLGSPRMLRPETFSLVGFTTSSLVITIGCWICNKLAALPEESAVAVRSNADLGPERSELEAKIHKLQDHIDVLRSRNNDLLRGHEELESIARTDNKQLGHMISVNKELLDKNVVLENELEEVQEQIKHSNHSNEPDDDVRDLEDDKQEPVEPAKPAEPQITRQDVLQAMSKPIDWDEEGEEVIMQGRRDDLEKEKGELQSTVAQLKEELATLRSKVDCDSVQVESEEKFVGPSQTKSQSNDWGNEIFDLTEKLAKSENARKELVDDNDKLSSEIERLEALCQRRLDTLNDVAEWTKTQHFTDRLAKEADDPSTNAGISTPLIFTPPNTADPATSLNIAGLPAPSPLPSINGTSTFLTPSALFHEYSEKKPHWIERERQIQNTELWKQNRKEVLRQLQAKAGESLKSPPVSNAALVG